MKTCTKCGETKELTGFYSAVHYRGGVQAECKECTKARSREYGVKNRDHVLARSKVYSAEKRKRIREATFAAYGGYICACCGETEAKFLTIDHINNDGAKFRKSIYKGNTKGNTAGIHTYIWLMKNGFPSGYQVLCMNCNYGKRMNGGVCPHKVKRNDYPQAGVGSSDPKRLASHLKLVG